MEPRGRGGGGGSLGTNQRRKHHEPADTSEARAERTQTSRTSRTAAEYARPACPRRTCWRGNMFVRAFYLILIIFSRRPCCCCCCCFQFNLHFIAWRGASDLTCRVRTCREWRRRGGLYVCVNALADTNWLTTRSEQHFTHAHIHTNTYTHTLRVEEDDTQSPRWVRWVP